MKTTTYNPFILSTCMAYIKANKIPFDASVDILLKQDFNVFDEFEEHRNTAIKNAEMLCKYYAGFYTKNFEKIKVLESKITPKNADNTSDKIKDLRRGFEEFEEYQCALNEAKTIYNK